MASREKILSALSAIDCATLNYDEWLRVVISARVAGAEERDVDDWCASDPERHKSGEVARIFAATGEDNAKGEAVTERTLWKFASERGWRWRDGKAECVSHAAQTPSPVSSALTPAQMAAEQLRVCFKPEETVCIVTKSEWNEKRHKWRPAGKGTFWNVAELTKRLDAVGRLEDAIGEYNHDAGAWMCVNPVNGRERGNADVSAHRLVLVESDSMPEDAQRDLILGLCLPVAAMTESGGKSVHALVRVDADGPRHYAERVASLFSFCEAHGLKVDPACKNPARLTRLAGAERGERTQRLLYLNVGKKSIGEAIRAGEAGNEHGTTGPGRFDHVRVARELIEKHHMCFIDGAPCVWNGSRYATGREDVERAMIGARPNIKERERREVYSYLKLEAPRYEVADSNLIAFLNGVLNVQTLELLEPSPEMRICNVIPHKWNPEAACPIVTETLGRIASGDPDVMENLLQAVGLCMTRDVSAGSLVLLQGEGSNGKSTFFRMVENLVGDDNYSTVPVQTIGDRFQTVPLMGVLANLGDDMPADTVGKTACAVLKQVVYGGTLCAEYKGADTFHFRPYCTLVYSCNEVPRFLDPSEGFRRRLHPIPLTARFTRQDPDFDPDIEKKLATPDAMETLARLAVMALKRVKEQGGMTENRLTREFRAELELENDSVLDFVTDKRECNGKTLEGEVADSVYREYRDWCEEGGCFPLSRKQFTKRIKARYGLATKPARMMGTGLVRVFCIDG